jgi:hypothetical protein
MTVRALKVTRGSVRCKLIRTLSGRRFPALYRETLQAGFALDKPS